MKKKILVILISSAMSGVWAESNNNIEVLDDVIVTATRSAINVNEAPGSVTVITRKDIEEKSGDSILDVLRGSAGISMQGVGTGGRKGLSLRGMSSKHTLILIDGKRIPSTNDSIGPNTDYQYDWVANNNIERIEVVRGPMSVLYGADALGGVINIITRKPTKNFEGDIQITSRLANGEFDNDGDGHDFDMNLRGKTSEKLQYSFNAKQSRRSSVESKLKLSQSAIEGKKKQQLSLGLTWQPVGDHEIKFDVTKGQEDRWYDTKNRFGVAYQSQYDVERNQVSLGWKGTVGKTTSALRMYQSNIDIINTATNGVASTAPQEITNTTTEGNISFPVGQRQFITAGFEHQKEKLFNTNLVGGKGDSSLKSLYFQDEIDLTDNVLFTLGARIDDHDTFGTETSPRVSLVWNATDRLILKGSYGHGFKAPNIKQISPGYTFPLGVIRIVSNPSLKPETNDALELGANYSTEKLNVEMALFDNKVKNLIGTRFDAFIAPPIQRWIYDNTASARLRGAEISTAIKLKKGLNLKTSYQYLDAKDGNNNRLKHRPRHTISSGITWKRSSWDLNLNAEFISGQIIDQRVAGAWVPKDVPSYTMWNVGMKKSINKTIGLSVGISNLTDVRLEDKSPAFKHEEYPRTLSLQLQGSF